MATHADFERAPAPPWYYLPLKRLIDIAVSAAVLIGLAPLWLAIGLAIRLTSPGPALFRGVVAGRKGRLFSYYKFRTMKQNNDDSQHREFLKNYVASDKPFTVETEGGVEKKVYKVINDPRVTGLGRILRKYSLDEIPQFINVLRGEMSVVGPRPPVKFEYEMYDRRTKQRLRVKPGITGLAQVKKRGTASFSEMVDLDLEYIRNRSLALDFKIMLATAGVMFGKQGYTG